MPRNDEIDPNPTRATLLKRLANRDDGTSWQEFFDIYGKLILGFARKSGLTEAEAMDAVQETMADVARNIPDFRYDPEHGSFKGWLFKLTRWRITDQLRKRGPASAHRAREDTDRTDTVARIPDPGAQPDDIWEVEWKRTLYDAALNRVKTQVDARQFQIFDFYVNKGWSTDKVARAFQVSENIFYLAKSRITESLRKEVQRLEQEGM